MFLCIQCRDIEYRVLLAPLQFLSQLSIQSFSLLQISQLHIFFQFHFFIVLHCLGIIQLIFQLVFFSITFQRCGICDGWVPSTSPHAKCLCCLEQKRVSEHCAKNCCSKPQTHKYQQFKLQQCLLKETVESSSDPFSQWFWKSSVYQVETHCSVVSTEPPHSSYSVLLFLFKVQGFSIHVFCLPSLSLLHQRKPYTVAVCTRIRNVQKNESSLSHFRLYSYQLFFKLQPLPQ